MVFGRRRDRYELIGDILESVRQGSRKTRLMYTANLSFELVNKYIAFLEDRGLISKRGDTYFLTERGRSTLEKLRRYRDNKREMDEILSWLTVELGNS
jgi:predicted transcriptional regulator